MTVTHKARGKRTINTPSTEKEKNKWQNLLKEAVEHVINDQGEIKRPQLDTWAVIDEWGFTPEEFRLLYTIARHERWKTLPGGQTKARLNGCYAAAERLRQLTGISRNKIFEILSLFQEANILKKEQARGRTPERRGKASGATLAGWTYEYTILPINKWAKPWELADLRENHLQKKKKTQQEKKTKQAS